MPHALKQFDRPSFIRSESDFAKYPFSIESSHYIRRRGLDVRDLASPTYLHVVDKAISRIREALVEGIVHTRWPSYEDEVEILSYPLAIALVAYIGNAFLGRRYALAEAKRVYRILTDYEVPHRAKRCISSIARGTFGWRMREIDVLLDGRRYEIAISLTDYLRNASVFRESKWRLVNRLVVEGYVHLTLDEAARLLQEEVRKRIEKKVQERLKFELSPVLLERVENVKKLLERRVSRLAVIEKEVKELVMEAFPPCVSNLYNALMSGRHVPHIGRFALTSFLLNAGMNVDSVVDLFSKLIDFDLKRTRYQVEHIAGRRGSRTKYTAPSCRTLRTYGLCISSDQLCKSINHPLAYYRRKRGMLNVK